LPARSSCRRASGFEGGTMAIELILGAAVAAALLVYLVFVLLHPERF
jgi:K+-transporting ATPase KdpF subunit